MGSNIKQKKAALIVSAFWVASALLLVLRFVSLNFVPSLLEPFRLLGVAALALFCVGWAYVLFRLK